ncbi:hypothetical protein K9N68_24550 [Kovacikia minuta CCNUW1]|uniref:hypothetical protein n=1 Tax=Kovacikia minuta TaxID=2931930 RepID=UPI001CCE69B1|nr:hypothetical protein [Kovacikia minuta]UBF24803.1 hypothetical protein K9N68_24550 [Kovacikia minuta CCNUW1]
MSSHFSLKSLAFYGIAIGSVVLLFSVVTAYGEANLKAPVQIKGRYTIAAQDLPGCLKSEQLLLLVEQSGIFLNGSLLPGDAAERLVKKAEERPSLTGRWRNQELVLDGPANHLPNCQGKIHIQGTIEGTRQAGKIEQALLNGTIHLGSQADAARFIAKQEPAEQPAEEKGH